MGPLVTLIGEPTRFVSAERLPMAPELVMVRGALVPKAVAAICPDAEPTTFSVRGELPAKAPLLVRMIEL